MAYSAVPTVNTGDQWSASDHNTYIKDNFAYFKGVTDALVAGTKPAEGRLTLETGVPLSSADQSAKATLYYTPYIGETIALYDGSSAWTLITFAELSLDISGYTAGKNYDIFCYNNSGTPTLEGLIWTNDSTRATALVHQDGVLVKTGATTRRYLGTIRVNASGGQTEDTVADRFVWNMYNRELRQMGIASLSGDTDQTALGKLEYVIGNPYGQTVIAGMGGLCSGAADSYCGLYLLFDTASVGSADAMAGIWSQTVIQLHCNASYGKLLAAGYHYVSMGLNVQKNTANLSQGYTWAAVWG